jgi:phage terminase small subunit
MTKTSRKGKRRSGKRKRTPRPTASEALRQQEFARHYLAVGTKTYFNAEKSAAAVGYSEKTVKHCAYALLRRPAVREEMQRLRAERAANCTIASPEEVLETLTTQMRVLPNKLYDEDGQLIPGSKLTDDQAQAVHGIKIKRRAYMGSKDEYIEEVTTEYKLTDRQKAAEILAKHHGLFEKDNAQGKPDPIQIQLVNAPRPMTIEEWEKQAEAVHLRMIARKAQPLQFEEKAA